MQLSFTVVAPSPGSTEDLPRERSTPEREAASATCAAYVVGRERNEQAHVDGQERPHHQLDEQPLGVQALRHGGGSGGQAAGDDDGDDQPDLQERRADERHAAEAEEVQSARAPLDRNVREPGPVQKGALWGGKTSAAQAHRYRRHRHAGRSPRANAIARVWRHGRRLRWLTGSRLLRHQGTGERTVLVGHVRGFAA